MKKWISYSANLLIVISAVALTASAPDMLSRVIVAAMTVIIFLGEIFGIFPLIQYSSGFTNAVGNIRKAQSMQPSMPWTAVSKMDYFFNQGLLDHLFDEYKKKAAEQQKKGMAIDDIDELINEDELCLRSWQGVVLQIPGTLTGLGLLGTFIGLLTGVSNIQISSVDATMNSIISLFYGIRVAFYTSISGVILSMVFNIVYKLIWNLTVRDLGVFLSAFKKNVIPSVKEQLRYSQKRDMEVLQDSLSNLPKYGAFSVANAGATAKTGSGSESILMPQILSGLQNGEFLFYLQPRYELNSNQIIGAEALVRWKHPKIGMVAPSVFIPVLEQNGYITKLDQYIWDQVCNQIRVWIDAGIRPVPISVNISKTDIMALNISELFSELLQKYRLPPRCIVFDIAQNAYLESKNFVLEFEKEVQEKGFKTVVDGFTGDFFALQSGDQPPYADAYKLDLRFCKEDGAISTIASKARDLQINLMAEGIENIKQMSELRKNGVTEGQGFYLAKSIPVEEFERMMHWRQD